MLSLAYLVAPANERKKEKGDTAAFDRLVELVRGKVFRVEATDAYPTGNSSVTITSNRGTTTIGGDGHVSLATNRGELFFRDSVLTGHLPFFGRAYSLPYGEGGGFEFTGNRVKKATVKVVKKREKQYVTFTCSVTLGSDVISLFIEAYENGSCTLQVNSNNRAAISYGGIIDDNVAP